MRLLALNHRHLNLGEIKSTGQKDVVDGPSETGKLPLKPSDPPPWAVQLSVEVMHTI